MLPPTALVIVEVVAVAVLHLAVVVSIVMGQRRQPTATLAWLLTVTLIPFAGALLYVVIGRTRTRGIVRRTRRAAELLRAVFEQRGSRAWQPDSDAPDLDERTSDMLELGERLGSVRASRGNRVDMLVNGAIFYRALYEAVSAAERQIHVQFYIIQRDETGVSLRDRLTDAARRGIEVRVLYDAVGSSNLDDDFWRPLTDAGGRAVAFNPVSFFTSRLRRRDRIDFRNHRKLVVIDGRVGFTGGINIGREYLGPDPEIGPDDVLVRVKACGLNYFDIFVRRGMPGLPVPMPWISGGDVAGEIAAVGSAVEDWKVGDRCLVDPLTNEGMMGEEVQGGMAELCRVPQEFVIALDPRLSFVEAAAIPANYGTVYRMLFTNGDMQPNDLVMIPGASRSLRTANVAVAKAPGRLTKP